MAKQKVVGIDLGTTNSCVCIMGDDGKIRIIEDKFRRKTVPSVVAVDGKGNELVGSKAKQRAGREPEPIFFIKRSMGHGVTVMHNGKPHTPEEISGIILKHLAQLAGEVLGGTIDQAVVTVPARFGIQAREATLKAGSMAGLEVKELLLEPVAAALTYGMQEVQDKFKIMVYDLGGGTFDVTLLEKKEGELKVLAWGGDEKLGGSDFDRYLASHIIERLSADGYDLNFDLENSEDQAKYTWFVAQAERLKENLSSEVVVDFRDRGNITDKNDETVYIDMEIAREELEGLIQDDVEKSIGCCKTTLQEAKLTTDDIDEIILVGGSSFIPLVRQRIEEEFSKKDEMGNVLEPPKIFSPDWSIAQGAAIKASTLESSYSEENVQLVFHGLTSPTNMEDQRIAGKIQFKRDGQGNLADLKVQIIRSGEPLFQTTIETNAVGGFMTDPIPLIKNSVNFFEFKVLDSGEAILLSGEFKIEHKDTAQKTILPPPQLAKPIHVLLASGMDDILKAGGSLPAKQTKIYKTVDNSGVISIPLYEENRQIGEILMENLGTSLPKSTEVRVTVEFNRDYTVSAEAQIPSINKSTDVQIKLPPPPPPPPVGELRTRFDKLKADFKGAIARVKDIDKRLEYGDQGASLIEEIHKLIGSKFPDSLKILYRLEELEGLINIIDIATLEPLAPPKAHFDSKIKQALELVKQAEAEQPKIREEGYAKTIGVQQEEGEKAYKEQNQARWTQINVRLDEIIKTLQDVLRKAEPQAPEDPRQVAMGMWQYVLNETAALAKQLEETGLLGRFQSRLDQAGSRLLNLKPKLLEGDPFALQDEIRKVYFEEVEEIKNEVEKLTQKKICPHPGCGQPNSLSAQRCSKCGSSLSLLGA